MRLGVSCDGAGGESVGRSRVFEKLALGSGTGVGIGTLGGGAVFTGTLGGGALFNGILKGGAGAAISAGRPGDAMTGRAGRGWSLVDGGGLALARCCLFLKRVARVDGRDRVREYCVGVGAGGATFVGEAATLKITASCFIAAICSVPKNGNGDAGDGLSSAAVNSRAASVAVSADDVAGIAVAWGKNSTERDILSARVRGI